MSQADSEPSIKVRQARDKLEDQVVDHPDVSLVDIGYDLEAECGEATERVVLRVHVQRPSAREALGLPAEIDAIPVRVVVADYRPERRAGIKRKREDRCSNDIAPDSQEV